MIIHIKGTNLDLTPAIKEYIETRVAPLGKYLGTSELGSDVIARVEISRTTRHHGKGDVYRAEINIDVTQNIARVEREGGDVRAMIDEAVEALKQILVKHKEKKSDH